MSEWKDNSTAPRDGTLIMVGWKFQEDADMQEYYAMYWSSSATNPLFAPGITGMWNDPYGNFTWTEDGGNGPTHWSPIN